MNVAWLPIDAIHLGSRIRPAYQEWVEALAASIEDCAIGGIGHEGLRHPIEVRARGNGYALIAGMHRTLAMEHLGRERIAAVVLTVDDITARQLEMEENLVRAELTKLDRAMFVAGYRDLFEAEHGEVKAGRPTEDNSANFAELATERLSMSIRSIELYLKIARCLHPDVVQLLRGTDCADNQKSLLELCREPPERHMEIVARLLDPESGFDTMREAITGGKGPTEADTDLQWLTKSWNRFHVAHKRVKKRLFNRILVDPNEREILRDAAEQAGFKLEPIKGWTGKS